MLRATIRQWHCYIGMFIAPSVLFFALTGALQVFSLHEAHGDYEPFPLVEKLASVHKDQVFKLGHHHAPASPTSDAGKPAAPKPDEDGDDKTPPAQLMLKAFFLIVAVSLAVSTAFGLWMGLKYTPRKGLAWGLFVAGAVLPVALLLLSAP